MKNALRLVLPAVCALVLAAVCLSASSAMAADSIWNSTTANWSGTPLPWLNQEPTSLYDAVIDNGGTAQITAGNTEYADDLFLGNTANHSGNVVMYGGNLYVDHHQNIGYDGAGSFTQYDGTNYSSYGTSGYDLRIGYNTGAVGTYTMSGGTCQASDNYVGRDGTGAFLQTGGTNNVGWSDSLHYLYIASQGTGTGTYRLGGTTSQLNLQHKNGDICVGGTGAGRFEWFRAGGGGIYIGHSGGTGKMVLASGLLGTLAMGYDFNVDTLMANGYIVTENLTYATLEITNGATGTLNTAVNPWIGNLRVGTMTGAGYGVQNHASSSLVVRADEWIGRGGTGTYTQSAGSHSITWHLYIGNDVSTYAGNGTFYLGGGSLACDVLAIGTNLVDDGGVGLLQQTNGTMTVSGTGNVFLGRAGSGHSGTYKISGGAWNVSGFVSGADNGHIIVDGGTVGVAGSINVRTFTVGESGTGSFTLGSGKSLTAYAQDVGKGSTGTFNLSGGTNTVSTDLGLAATAGTGAYKISSGTLQVNGAIVGGAGSTLTKDGGTLTVAGNITVGTFIVGDTATGTFALSGSKQLSATAEYVGKGGTGTFTQSGGTHTVGALYAGYSAGASGSYAQSLGTTTVSGHAYLGYLSGSTGSYDISGGTLDVADGNVYLGYQNTGSSLTLRQNGTVVAQALIKSAGNTFTDTPASDNYSVLRVNQLNGMGTATVGGHLQIGHSGGLGSGSHSVSGSDSLSVGRDLAVGYDAAGAFSQSGGTVTVGGTLRLAAQGSASGAYTLGGGTLTVAAIQKGSASGGSTFTYDGGTLQFSGGKSIDVGNLRVAYGSGTSAGLSLASGDSIAAAEALLGDGGTGTVAQSGGAVSATGQLVVGGTSGTGQYTFTGGSLTGGSLVVRAGEAAAGEFTGRGIVGMTGLLTNSGRITADGDYTAAALNLASLAGVANRWDNPYEDGGNGWFAVKTGKLLLPAMRIIPLLGSTYNWGESPYGSGPGQDSEIDLVNSVQVHFNGLKPPDDGGGGGTEPGKTGLMSIDLLALDRSDLPAPPSGVAFIGAWDVHAPTGVVFTDADLTFRYDDGLAGMPGIEESDLRVYHWDGGNWVDAWSGTDESKNLIWADGITTFSPFAVGTPEPATLVLLAAGAGAMLLVGRRRRRAML